MPTYISYRLRWASEYNINFHNGCQLKAFGFNHRFTFISYIILRLSMPYTFVYVFVSLQTFDQCYTYLNYNQELCINLSISYLVRVRFNLSKMRVLTSVYALRATRTNTNSNTHIAWPKYFSWNVQIYRWLTITSSEHTKKATTTTTGTRCC